MSEAKLTEYSPKRIISIAVALGFNVLANSIIYPFLPLYLHSERGIPMNRVGLVFIAMGIAQLIGAPIAGILADRIGRRILLLYGPMGRSLCYAVLAYMAYIDAPFGAIGFMVALATLVSTFFRNAANAYVTDFAPPEKRTAAFSTLRIGLNVGFMTGPAIGAFLSRTPFSLLFCMTALACLATSFIVDRYCPALPLQKNIQTEKPKRESLFKIIFRDHQLLILLIFGQILFLSTSQFIAILTVFAKEVVKVDQNLIGYLFTINGLMVICFQVPLNNLLKRWRLNVRMGTGAALYIIAYLGIGMSTCWLHLAGCMIVLTLGEVFAVTAIMAAVSNLAPRDKVGRYMGAFGLVQGLGWALGPYIGSQLFEPLRNQPLLLWAVLAIGALIGGIGLLFHKNPQDKTT